MDALQTLFTTLFYAGVGLAVVFGAVWLGRLLDRGGDEAGVSSTQRDERLHRAWEDMRNDRTPDARLIQVTNAHQDARRGTKAVIRFLRTGLEFRSWFWRRDIRTGSFALVTGSFGHGPHENDHEVFYVREVLHLLPPGADEAVDRHRRRQASRVGS